MISVDRIVLPNRPLSNLEITESVKKLRMPSFRGVFVRDALPRTPTKNECGILNLDDASGNGTHWVLLRQLRRPTSARIERYLNSAILYTTEKTSLKEKCFVDIYAYTY